METPVGEERSQLDGHHLISLLKKLQNDAAVDRVRLGGLEWKLLPALRHQAEPRALYARLAAEPAFFLEVLVIHYKARSAPKSDEPADENKQARVKRAWQLLRDWSRVPGTRDDGTVDAVALNRWINEARALAAKADREVVGDLAIGGAFARSPEDPDGTWPCLAVREVIERLESDGLGRGFMTAVFNGRGVNFRVMSGGGLEEREQARRYESLASLVRTRWPRTGALLDAISHRYVDDARARDQESARDE